ncbi:MAG: hypothetical protein RL307_1138 [Pseudomonadota bacterium]|jgi:hypothetical protein
MMALRWIVLMLLLAANLVVAAWMLGWSSWMPFPHETPREPERAEHELRANAITVVPNKTSAGDAASNSSAPSH